MSITDWSVLFITLCLMISYGLYKGHRQQGAHSYLLADRQMPWYIVLLGIMATQASAITFLSAPGQAYTDGMRFVQYYFGLPIAMVVICVTFIPIFRQQKVFTAYQYLEQRFDKKTRLLTSLLFLLSRGLSTGISIYAPAIIISSILGINVYTANIVTGGLLLIYTCTGGAKAVAHTQKLQFLIILSAMGLATYLVIQRLPNGMTASDALYVAGKSGKLNIITTGFSWKDKYNIWSGIIGGFFLALSYFGTDQSQVGRYITARDDRNGKMGLLLNGLVKIPMQFMILLTGVFVFVLYSLYPAPLYCNSTAYNAFASAQPQKAAQLQKDYQLLHSRLELATHDVAATRAKNDTAGLQSIATMQQAQADIKQLKDSVAHIISQGHYGPDNTDTNYIFLNFVKTTLPQGVIGLLFAVIILASWGSISAALNSLAACSLVDIHLRNGNNLTEKQELQYGRWHTLAWGIFCILVAMFAARLGSLIEAVNILGSLFYGTILGIFLVAFYMKKAGGTVVFTAALITESVVIAIYACDIVSFLWLNVIGALLVPLLCAMSYLLPGTTKKRVAG